MNLATGIRKHGFRKWYERELLAGHAHMALAFMCVIGFIGALEAASRFRGWSDQAVDLFAMLACGAVGLWALRRYLYLLMHAESVANQADCPGCGTYARFTLVQADAQGERVGVQCRRCEHRWTIVS